MSNAPAAKDPTTKVVLIILAVVGGIFVVCMGGAMVLIVAIAAITALGESQSSVFSDVTTTIGDGSRPSAPPGTARRAAEEFCEDLYYGRAENAYARLSAPRREAWTLRQFRTELDRRPTIKDSTDYRVIDSVRRNTPQAYDCTFHVRGRRQEITFTVIREGDGWKVDDLVFWD
jgi:hypothetical protein